MKRSRCQFVLWQVKRGHPLFFPPLFVLARLRKPGALVFMKWVVRDPVSAPLIAPKVAIPQSRARGLRLPSSGSTHGDVESRRAGTSGPFDPSVGGPFDFPVSHTSSVEAWVAPFVPPWKNARGMLIHLPGSSTHATLLKLMAARSISGLNRRAPARTTVGATAQLCGSARSGSPAPPWMTFCRRRKEAEVTHDHPEGIKGRRRSPRRYSLRARDRARIRSRFGCP